MITIDRECDALLVIDVQNDFCPGGALAVPRGDEVVAPIARLMPRFAHVVASQDWHPAGHKSFASSHAGRAPYETIDWRGGRQTLWPDHCVQGTRGAEFVAALDLRAARLIVRKGMDPQVDSYSAFRDNERGTETGLAGALRALGVERVVLAGLAFDYCVAFTALDAREAGFAAVVLEDACRAIDLDGSADAARTRMKERGVVLARTADLT